MVNTLAISSECYLQIMRRETRLGNVLRNILKNDID